MGNTLSPSSRGIHRDASRNCSGHSEKENRGGGRPRFVSPENRVLPFVTDGPQKLRSTDNGNILHSGGTISGRRHNNAPPGDRSEFTQYLQKKCQAYQHQQIDDQDIPFQTMFGHRKSHSDPNIVRKMMEEDDDGSRFESESCLNPRSVIALSPSKAKIKSRKKKKAPEPPPHPNTLPRTAVVRGSSFKGENLRMHNNASPGDGSEFTQYLQKNGFSASYDTSEAPRRPLPPIPLEEMPPPPPHPPPDYNSTPDDREGVKGAGKGFQKNRRTVDKWRFSRSNNNNGEGFAERRQRSKSLDRTEEARTRDKEGGKGFDRNYSLRRVDSREKSPSRERGTTSSSNDLTDAIVEAAKKRAERLARTRMCRNLSFRSSMEHSSGPFEASPTINGSNVINYPNTYNGHQNLPTNRISEAYTNGNGYRNGYLQHPMENAQNFSQVEHPEVRPSHIAQGPSDRGRCLQELQNSRSSDNIREPKSQYNTQNGYERDTHVTGHLDQIRPNGNHHHKDHHSHSSSGSQSKDGRMQHESNNGMQYKNEIKYSREQSTRENVRENFQEITEENPNLNHEISSGIANRRDGPFSSPEAECLVMETQNFRNFSRMGAMHKRSNANRKKNFEGNVKNEGKARKNINIHNEMGILPTLPDKKTRRNSRAQKTVIPFPLNGSMSSSSTSEEEIEINLQLRPTLPRRPVDIPRFSPTDVWKSINLDFFKSHQQSSDISSEDGEDIMEEKIHRINRPVAPRRLINDRSGDSGISPDAGSPMFLNEKFDPHVISNAAPVVSSPNVAATKEPESGSWVPQHDLEDSECGSDNSPENNKENVANATVQPKLAMPNLMFPTRSLSRSDPKTAEDGTETPEKEKGRTRDRKKRFSKGGETQHFNSLRNLKRALNIKSKTPAVDVNGLDSNWSLSRSLPNFEDVETLEEAKREKEIPEVSILDHIRRSNSESRMMPRENDRIFVARTAQMVNPEWRKSFPGQSSDGHVMYLPEYCSYRTNNKREISEHATNIDKDNSDEKQNNDHLEKNARNKKKFSYQSTVRQQAKKKLEEQLEKEVKEKEKKRETEIEWMNMVEDEFRKQRIREKSDVRQRLRIYALQVNKKSKNSNYSNLENGNEVPDNAKCTGDDIDNLQGELHSSYNSDENGIPDYILGTQNVSGMQNIGKDAPNSQDFLNYNLKSSPIQSNGNISPEFSTTHQLNNPKGFPTKYARQKDFQNNVHEVEELQVPYSPRHNNPNTGSPPKSYIASKTFNGDENMVNGHSKNVPGTHINSHRSPEYSHAVQDISGRRNDPQDYITRSNLSMQDNIQQYYDKDTYTNQENYKKSYMTDATNRIADPHSVTVTNKDHRNGLTELVNQPRVNKIYTPHSTDKDPISNKLRNGDASGNIRQQPTGMKKWLRRQNRDHRCHENMPRPEPEGGRSSSDDSKYVDGRRENLNPRLQPVGANLLNNNNYRCNHGNGSQCAICNNYSKPASGFLRNGVHPKDAPGRPRRSDDSEQDHHMGVNGQSRVAPHDKPHLNVSVEEYEQHTRLCRTNSGRTFESHSYYALERRKEQDSTECESPKDNSNKEVPPPKSNFFSSLNFKRELKENARRKSRDFEKRTRKYQDYDSDDSGSDGREAPRYQRHHNVRNQKKSSQHREPSFSRNHPHRIGMKLD